MVLSINLGMMTSERGDWRTPRGLFDRLNARYRFTIDGAASKENALCKRFWSVYDDALKQSWASETVFLNPPYGRNIGLWTAKSLHETQGNDCLVVGLLPARTDTRWFHEHIYHKAEITFVRGRLHFDDGKQAAPFPSMIVVWGYKI
jgi:phage N-6-adenine-methyltransferase